MDEYYDLMVDLLFDDINVIYKRAGRRLSYTDLLPKISNELIKIKNEARNISFSVDKYSALDEVALDSINDNVSKPLESIFNVFRMENNKKQNMVYKINNKNDTINFAVDNNFNLSNNDYESLCDYIDENGKKALINNNLNNILSILEYSASYIPCRTENEEIYDVSLYNNSKLTAAIAGCLYYCTKENNENKYPYLLVSADVSGIQSFIYTISSKGALKSLRGRSFYLEIIMENIIDEILDEAGLCRSNLLYSGGGHFYMLLPNTEAVKKILDKTKENLNNWFIEKYQTRLYIELDYVTADNNTLCNNDKDNNLIGELYKSVGHKVSKGKLQRYSNEQLQKLILDNTLEKGLKDCQICHKSVKNLVEFNENSYCCENCKNIMELGNALPRIESGKTKLIISREEKNKSLELPSINTDKVYLYLENNEYYSDIKNTIRKYSVNSKEKIYDDTINLWCGIYSKESSEENKLISLEELASKSIGIKRLGVLRADVDNLGQAFISGFENNSSLKEKYKYISLSRNCNLSYDLSQFFKYEINKICSGKIGFKQFKIIDNNLNENEAKNVVIVYAGGDDLFIVGAWNEIIELGVDINNCFKKFSNNKMSLSAGIGIFHDKYPMNQMAEYTGKLEHSAKTNGKNRLSLFDCKAIMQNKDSIDYDLSNIYEWDDFANNVCRDKLAKLYKWFAFNEEDKSKMPIGMSLIYRLLTLVREIRKGNKINLARVAYAIGRLEPKNKIFKEVYEEFKKEFYKWMLDKEDLRQVETALTLAVYLNRKGEDE